MLFSQPSRRYAGLARLFRDSDIHLVPRIIDLLLRPFHLFLKTRRFFTAFRAS